MESTFENIEEDSNDITFANNLAHTELSFTTTFKHLKPDQKCLDDAWNTYKRIHQNVTLEGDCLHWLACAYYVACLQSSLKTPRNDDESAGTPLSKVLSTVKLSLLHFFQKIRKWLEMGKFESALNTKIDQLERNFSVSSIVFEKYTSIFSSLYKEKWTESGKRSRKRMLLMTHDIFKFGWSFYIRIKAQYPDINDDLLNSYHLLLCCIDLIFVNVLCSKQLKSAIKEDCPGVSKNFMTEVYTDGDLPSILGHLCKTHEGVIIETKIIRRHYLGKFLEELLKSSSLKGNLDRKTNLLDQGSFEANCKYLNESYSDHISRTGGVDERVFIQEDSDACIGTPTKRLMTLADVDDKERSHVKRNLQECFNKAKGFTVDTPLTSRRWLAEKSENYGDCAITTSVGRMQELITGLKPAPSENLANIFGSFSHNPEEKLKPFISQLSNAFLKEYSKDVENDCDDGPCKDIAKARLHSILTLYYKILEICVIDEKKKSSADLTALLEQELFNKCLFACCIEIVMFSYSNSRTFPWILKVYNLSAYNFFKIIELVIRSEELSREIIKHLSRIEEKILESLSWETGSPIFNVIKNHGVPRCQDVAADSGVITPMFFMSPTTVRLNKDGLQHSPVISLRERFTSPISGSPVKRNLFGTNQSNDQSSLSVAKNLTQQFGTSVVLPPKPAGNQSPISSVRLPIMLASPGSNSLQLITLAPQRGVSPNKAKKYGSLGIFFRKLYHMMSLRMKDLCDKLSIGADLQKKIWTCFEYSLVSNTDMFCDRHVDQLLMCAVYVMSKVTKEDKSFHHIMKYYRMQPQFYSDVYRHVLIRRASERPEVKSETMETTNGSQKENANEYNDLIQFYNIIYIKKMKDFALKFDNKKTNLDAPTLSPLPAKRKQQHSPRKVSKQHEVYISPRKPSLQMTPSKLLYCFDSDPSQKLGEINAMINSGTRRKVLLDYDDDQRPSPNKRPMNGLAKRAQELRQEQSRQSLTSGLK